MGLAGARNAAVTGLQAQSTGISISADNIANAGTPGYKAVRGLFSTLVTNTAGSSTYSSGGVSVSAKSLVEKQGLIQATGRATDLAISGTGFFAVQDASGTLLLTRAGSFDVNNSGELVNAGGYKLMAWPLDSEGRRPGATGNNNTTAAESVDSLVVVDTNAASGTASATTSLKTGLNLNAGQTRFQGSTVTIDPSSVENADLDQGDIIVPGSGMEEGDEFTLTSDSISTTFTYGGFAKSADITLGTGLFGATTTNTSFTASSSLVSGDKFTITTLESGTVTFTYIPSNPDTSAGEFNSFDSLADAINANSGLTARTSNGVLYVSSENPNNAITFADVAGSNLDEELGFSSEPAAASGVNRFSSIQSLYNLVKDSTQLDAVVNNSTTDATIDIFSKDPLLTLTLTKNYDIVDVDLSSAENGNNDINDVIVPFNNSTSMTREIGDGTPIGASVSTVSFDDGTNSGTYSYGGIGVTKDISSGIFGATTAIGVDATDKFTAGGGLANGVTITFSDGTATQVVTCDLTTATGSLAAGSFNSLITLAAAISSGGAFSARVENGKLYIASADLGSGAGQGANRAVGVSATTGGITGANIVAAFGGDFGGAAANTCTIVAAQDIAGGANNRFATLAQLDSLLTTDGFTTDLVSGSNATLGITGADQITIAGAAASASADLLKELGLAAGAVGDGFFTELGVDGIVAAGNDEQEIAVTYDPSDDTLNMAGGNITPHFPRNVRIFDSLGTGHDFRLSFLKTGNNKWAVEFYALDPTEISGRADGQVATGTVQFNGDGSLKSITSSLSNDINISWTNGASQSTISFDLGTAGQPAGTVGATVIGLTDGLRQFDAAYNVEFLNQNGVAAGQFKGISVTADGTINALFSNGEIKPIYQLPVITVADQNSLSPKTGNVFEVTQASGDVNLKIAGQGGAGVIVPSSIEGSTSDIAEELTNTIGIQANYNANATLISTIRSMEDELNRRL